MLVERVDRGQVQVLGPSVDDTDPVAPQRHRRAHEVPFFEIRGTQVFRSAWHPEGPSSFPLYEIRGDKIFGTVWSTERA